MPAYDDKLAKIMKDLKNLNLEEIKDRIKVLTLSIDKKSDT